MDEIIAAISFKTIEFDLEMARTELYASHVNMGYLRYDIEMSDDMMEVCCTILQGFNNNKNTTCEYNIKMLRFGLKRTQQELVRR